jgi:hypothetical protein
MSSGLSVGDISIYRIVEQEAPFLPALDVFPGLSAELLDENRAWLAPRFDVDRDMAAKTRRGFFERYCDTRTLCCTAHFPSPSIGRVTRWDDGFRCDFVEA